MLCLAFVLFVITLGGENSWGTPLRVLSYNILTVDNFFSTGPWRIRKQRIAQLVRQEQSDIVGMQEALFSMMEGLSALLPDHAYVGVGRDDGQRQGEYAGIFYRTSRLELLETKTFWLSENPDFPGRIGWDARCPRIVTWAYFRDRKTGTTFYIFNTHFDHRGKRAQKESARLLAKEALRISQGRPSIVMGDFNVSEDSRAYRLFKKYSGFLDAISLGPHEGPRWTFSFYGLFKSKIDFIFVHPSIKVYRHAILPEDPWAPTLRSDHLPISTLVEIP